MKSCVFICSLLVCTGDHSSPQKISLTKNISILSFSLPSSNFVYAFVSLCKPASCIFHFIFLGQIFCEVWRLPYRKEGGRIPDILVADSERCDKARYLTPPLTPVKRTLCSTLAGVTESSPIKYRTFTGDDVNV